MSTGFPLSEREAVYTPGIYVLPCTDVLLLSTVSLVLFETTLSELVLALELYMLLLEDGAGSLFKLNAIIIISKITATIATPAIIKRFIGITTILVEELMRTLP